MVNFTRVLGLAPEERRKDRGVARYHAEHVQQPGVSAGPHGSERRNQGGAGSWASISPTKKHFFPPLVSGMVRIGESTGNLEENLEYLADYYDDEVDSKLHSLTSLIEPLMLLIMGVLVGFVALSIITPIYSISQGIQ